MKIYNNLLIEFINEYLQLAILISHSCRSNGYSFRSIGHASVNDILQKTHKSIFLNASVNAKLQYKKEIKLKGHIYELHL